MIWLLMDQWFLIMVGVLVLLASQIQVPESHQASKSDVVNFLCVGIIVAITGLTLPTQATVFGVVALLGTNHHFMDGGLMVGLVSMGCISTLVLMTRIAHGNDAVTVVESTLGKILAPFLTPLLMSMYLACDAWWTHSVPTSSSDFGPLYRRVFKQLGLSMLLPPFVGQLVQNISPSYIKTIMTKYKVAKLSSFSLLVIIWSTYDKGFSSGAFTVVASRVAGLSKRYTIAAGSVATIPFRRELSDPMRLADGWDSE
ncbi:hypothetical protein PUNSTDRAFT_128818 [Punctularia strigosozonata HHB-11173 SS5]|uniref:uncharacterized protein n=1 Tax=Punctularia strigosozonata (strain HHB-11173) TaxID=741275 RepID=UPI0004417F45|nr:uncharacterized protein PUNSTDRAFT_128818 [Punctularia strigosozonata HHB-11173 SS5]EIN13134.1 hypothetical protein PUNSTDRAFT_128818 [Punctularia strigosozonata HHB-11173 SS5]